MNRKQRREESKRLKKEMTARKQYLRNKFVQFEKKAGRGYISETQALELLGNIYKGEN